MKNVNLKRKRKFGLFAYVLAGTLVFANISKIPVNAEGNAIYVSMDGASENSGVAADSPLDSIYEAQKRLPEGGTIVINSTIYITGERYYSLQEGITLEAAEDLEGPVFEIAKGGRLTLNNIVIIGQGSTLILNNGVLKMDGSVSLQVADSIGLGGVYTGAEASTYLDDHLVAGIAEARQSEEQTAESETMTEEIIEEMTEEVETSPESEAETQTVQIAETESNEAPISTENSKPDEKETTAAETVLLGEQETQATETQTKIPESGQAKATAPVTASPEKASPEKAKQKKQERTSEPTKAVQKLQKAITALDVHSRDDIMPVVAATKTYDVLSASEQSMLSRESLQLLKSAQEMAAAYNQTQLGVSVYGNLPWYVQFRVTMLDGSGQEEDGLQILMPYELELWNLYTDEPYTLPKGETVTVTMPVPDVAIQGEFTIFHYKSDGSVETIKPVIRDGLMIFQTSSFSPFSVAGNNVIAGVGVEPNGGSGNDSSGTTTSGTDGTGSTTSGNDSQSGTATNAAGTNNHNPAVNTGDTTNIWPMVIIGASALLLVVVIILLRRRK